MTAGHTPGPWSVGTGIDPDDQVFGADGGIVADCKWTKHEREEKLANTRLIAAAPELLEALAEMVYETTHLSPQDDDGSHWCRITADALAKARAAIAKATGGAP